MNTISEVTLFDLRKSGTPKAFPVTPRPKQEPLVAVGKKDKTLVPASEASRELARVQGAWPFDLFPDVLIIEEKRIILKKRTFPFYTTTTTIPVNKVLTFEVTHSIFFSSLNIKGFIGYNLDVTFQWLSHENAQRIKDIVDGLRLTENESIEILEKDKRKLSYTLEKVGHVY